MPRSKRFRFENMWIQEKECRSIIQECWGEGDNDGILRKMANYSARLEEWGGGMTRDLNNRISNYRRDMQRLKSRRDTCGVRMYNEARWNYLRLLEKQEIFWRQRANQFWLKDGDKNTRFFHKVATVRKDHNRIKRLKNDAGEWQDTDESIQNTIIKYFENIFTSTNVDEQMPDGVMFKRITDNQKESLLHSVSEEETKAAVFAMYPEKSPGMDGLNPCFFQAYWHIVKNDVTEFCRKFLEHGELPEQVNRTLVCLIPKIKQPKQVSDLRPISLCNVLMRILSKVLANRLKPCLHSIISENQECFR